jgi:glycosyltransferase involved in cell wall biosynthesis
MDSKQPMPPFTYSIVIPCYNEGERVGDSLEKIVSYTQNRGWNTEILVVNDGSRDNTVEIVRSFTSRHGNVRLIENPGNRGKGYSVRNGVLSANGDVILFTDADLSSPIEESEKLFGALEAGADVALGSRWLRAELQTYRQPLYRQMLGRMFNLVLRMILGLHFKDTQCGFKAFRRTAAQTIFPRQRIDRWGFDPEILYLARKFKLRTVEVPVSWAHDHRSKINPVLDGSKMMWEMLRVRANDVAGKYERPSFTPPVQPSPVEKLAR